MENPSLLIGRHQQPRGTKTAMTKNEKRKMRAHAVYIRASDAASTAAKSMTHALFDEG